MIYTRCKGSVCHLRWLNFHSSWTPSHHEMGSVTLFKMSEKLKVEMKTAILRFQKYYPYRIFSFTYSIQDISMLMAFRFCRDWEFRAMKIQARSSLESIISSELHDLPLNYCIESIEFNSARPKIVFLREFPTALPHF
jgi:hypothetical protein